MTRDEMRRRAELKAFMRNLAAQGRQLCGGCLRGIPVYKVAAHETECDKLQRLRQKRRQQETMTMTTAPELKTRERVERDIADEVARLEAKTRRDEARNTRREREWFVRAPAWSQASVWFLSSAAAYIGGGFLLTRIFDEGFSELAIVLTIVWLVVSPFIGWCATMAYSFLWSDHIVARAIRRLGQIVFGMALIVAPLGVLWAAVEHAGPVLALFATVGAIITSAWGLNRWFNWSEL